MFFNTRQAYLHVSLLLQIRRENHRHKEKTFGNAMRKRQKALTKKYNAFNYTQI